jgi:ferredoxin-NADP reductase
VYLCGNNAFVQAVGSQLAARGVPAAHVHCELFSPNDWLLKASGGAPELRCGRCTFGVIRAGPQARLAGPGLSLTHQPAPRSS